MEENGTNTLFSDKEFDGIIIKLDEFNEVEVELDDFIENHSMEGNNYHTWHLSREFDNLLISEN